MTVLGLISEYNPFHFGHKYHIDQSKALAKADFVIGVMSGSFLQRGEPAFVDKWTRAKMAIDGGLDLVLELPFLYSSQSAEYFAYGGVKLLDRLNIVDAISFGSETGDLGPLKQLADIYSEEPILLKTRLKYYLSEGNSFSVSRSMATADYLKSSSNPLDYHVRQVLAQSNNILGIEYLKALNALNSPIKPLTIKRSGHDYNDKALGQGFASASGIRSLIMNKDIHSSKDLIPISSYAYLNEFHDTYGKFNYLSSYGNILIYLLRTLSSNKLNGLMNAEKGLINRIVSMSFQEDNIESLISASITKSYPRTRIQRLLVHLLNDFYLEDFKSLFSSYPSYLRVLGANDKGLHLLKKIKESSDLPIITKFADYKKYKSPYIDRIISLDKKATDIFFMGLDTSGSLTNMDYLTSPYIRK